MNVLSSYRLSLLTAATALALSAPAFAQSRVNLDGLQTAESHDSFIVKYRPSSQKRSSADALQQSLDAAARVLPNRNGRPLTVRSLRRMAVGAEVVRVGRKLSHAEAESLMRQLAADPDVEYVAVNGRRRTTLTPNDPLYNGSQKQWHYFEATGGVNLPAAWDKAQGEGIVVAVVDTGHFEHTDLLPNLIPGYDFVSLTGSGQGGSNDGDGRDADPRDSSNHGHGTHVAGTVAAVTNNSRGVAGVAFKSKVLVVRGLGQSGYGEDADIADGVVWASGGHVNGVPDNQNPAEVINLSLGGSGSCPTFWQEAINQAVANGATVVVAAGNNNGNVSNFTPANCNNVIAVAANDRQGAKASYSNYGAKIDITAPGDVLSTTGTSGYGQMSGTSMATPHMAGIVALMQSAAPTPLTPAQIEQILKQTARPLPGNCSGGCGAGIADATAAVNAVADPGVPTAEYEYVRNLLTVGFTDKSTDSNGQIVSRSWEFGDGTTSTEANPSKTYAQAGTYAVKLTVTDNDGKTDSETKSLAVTDGNNRLTNGTPVTGLGGAQGATLRYTMDVPAGATGLKFVTGSGSGDPDLYAKFNVEPTTTSSDCKSDGSTTSETCTIPTAQAGTYHVLVYGYAQFSGVSLTGSYTAPCSGGNCATTYTNTADYTINDNATVESPITVSGRTGNAPGNTPVNVNIVHTFRGDLKVDLVAPDGSVYLLKNYSSSDSADNVNATYTVNLSTEALNGIWKLRVNDNWVNDSGYINSWSVTF